MTINKPFRIRNFIGEHANVSHLGMDYYCVHWEDGNPSVLLDKYINNLISTGDWKIVDNEELDDGLTEAYMESLANVDNYPEIQDETIFDQIKTFVSSFTASVTIGDGFYEVYDEADDQIYRASSDEELVEIMNAFSVLSDYEVGV